MGAMIKGDETRKGTERKVRRQSELMRSVLVHVVSAFICALVCCYSYWFPWFYCFINHIVWIYLPNVWPVVFGPKCMFVLANAIVVVVVGDWRQTCAKSENIHEDMYDEYLRRSRGPRRVLVYKERKKEATFKKIYAKEIEIKKADITKEIIEEEKEETVEEIHEGKEEIFIESNVKMSEEKNEEMAEEKQEVQDDVKNSIEDLIESDGQNELAAPHDHDEEINLPKETRLASYDGRNGCTKKVEETRSADDELNKRVKAFIARVNRRRWAEAEAEAEANNWLICSV